MFPRLQPSEIHWLINIKLNKPGILITVYVSRQAQRKQNLLWPLEGIIKLALDSRSQKNNFLEDLGNQERTKPRKLKEEAVVPPDTSTYLDSQQHHCHCE